MGKVIDFKKWKDEHRWEEPYVDMHNYEFDEETKAMFDYVDDSLDVLHDYLIGVLVVEGVLPKEYEIETED